MKFLKKETRKVYVSLRNLIQNWKGKGKGKEEEAGGTLNVDENHRTCSGQVDCQ